jgi:hypothetical protein
MISKDERATVTIIRSPEFPIAVVEGTYKGERRAFVCLMSKDKAGKIVVDAPLAMLLDESDFQHVKGYNGSEPGAPKIEIVKG